MYVMIKSRAQGNCLGGHSSISRAIPGKLCRAFCKPLQHHPPIVCLAAQICPMHFFQQKLRSESSLAASDTVDFAPISKISVSQAQQLPQFKLRVEAKAVIVQQRFPQLHGYVRSYIYIIGICISIYIVYIDEHPTQDQCTPIGCNRYPQVAHMHSA